MPDVIISAHFGMEKIEGFGKYSGSKFGLSIPLKRLVTLTTVLRYLTACDGGFPSAV